MIGAAPSCVESGRCARRLEWRTCMSVNQWDHVGDMKQLENIVAAACIAANTEIYDLWFGGNHRAIVDVRRRIAIKAREAGYSYPEIGRALHRHHTSIINLVSGRRALALCGPESTKRAL